MCAVLFRACLFLWFHSLHWVILSWFLSTHLMNSSLLLHYVHLSPPLLLSYTTADRPDPAWWWHFTHADLSQITSPWRNQSQGQGHGFCWGLEGGGCWGQQDGPSHHNHSLPAGPSVLDSHSSCFVVLLMSGPHGTRISWARDGQSQQGQAADAWLILLRLQSAYISSDNWNGHIEINAHTSPLTDIHKTDCTK